MNRSMFLVSMMLTVILGAPLHALAEPLYTLTVIGGAGSSANAINSTGQVAGYQAAAGAYHAFFYDGIAVADLGTLGGASSTANALNDNGVVVGRSDTADGPYQGFVYANGVMSSLPFTNYSEANSINNAGVIAGTFGVRTNPDDPPDYFYPRAFVYADGVATNLGLLPGNEGGLGSYANAINNAGVVAGAADKYGAPDYPSHAFLYRDGVMQDLDTLGGQSSDAYAINDLGQVVGSAGVPSTPTRPNAYGHHAFLYSGGVLQDLGALSERGDSVAFDINNLGQAVGNADIDGVGARAVLYENGGVFQLDTLIDTADGWSVLNAAGINDAHQIAGTACRLGVCYAVRLDLAAAIPEPQQLFLLIAGMLILVLARRWSSITAQTNDPRTRRGSYGHGSLRNAQTI